MKYVDMELGSVNICVLGTGVLMVHSLIVYLSYTVVVVVIITVSPANIP